MRLFALLLLPILVLSNSARFARAIWPNPCNLSPEFAKKIIQYSMKIAYFALQHKPTHRHTEAGSFKNFRKIIKYLIPLNPLNYWPSTRPYVSATGQTSQLLNIKISQDFDKNTRKNHKLPLSTRGYLIYWIAHDTNMLGFVFQGGDYIFMKFCLGFRRKYWQFNQI